MAVALDANPRRRYRNLRESESRVRIPLLRQLVTFSLDVRALTIVRAELPEWLTACLAPNLETLSTGLRAGQITALSRFA
jgi:hypothetical protein